jgi:hypothetical protein
MTDEVSEGSCDPTGAASSVARCATEVEGTGDIEAEVLCVVRKNRGYAKARLAKTRIKRFTYIFIDVAECCVIS